MSSLFQVIYSPSTKLSRELIPHYTHVFVRGLGDSMTYVKLSGNLAGFCL